MNCRKSYLLILLVAAAFTGKAQSNIWPLVTKEMKPWTRWWWMGSAVDEKNIARALEQYHEVGFGGVEITPIYGAKGFENKYIPFLSSQWLQMLKFSVDGANARGMGVDMNLGTGWPFGGPQITSDFAATKMIVQRYSLNGKEKLAEKIVVKEVKQADAKLQALRAIAPNGTSIDLMPFIAADGTLNWTPNVESVDIIAFFEGKTRQKVKRSAPGGEGYTLDHLDKKSVDVYLDRFDKAFSGNQPGVRSFFNDSYEVYGANWTPLFFQEFKKIKGYNLEDYLAELTDKNVQNDKVARVKSDYREVMSELLQRNFLDEFTGFSHKYRALSRNQAHGSPGNLIDLYAATDIAECETFGSSFFPVPGLRRDSSDIRNVDPDPMMFKFATSATNTHGKKYTSSETFTWLTDHFKTSLSQAKPEVEQLFLSGVNHVFYHGTTYSPEEAGYPGWLFYASVNFVPNNSFWPHLKGLNEYITRVQSVLQSTKADHEILMYWPIYDVWNNPKGLDMALKVHNVDNWLHPTAFYKQSLILSDKGYSFDFATDKIIGNSKVIAGNISTSSHANPYKVLLIPESSLMSEVTLENILGLARNGASIIFQSLPKDVPGLANLEERRAKFNQLINTLDFKSEGGLKRYRIGNGEIILSQDFGTALSAIKINREELVDKGLRFTRRVNDNDTFYYVVNHSANNVNEFVKLKAKGNQVILMDPQNGEIGEADVDAGSVRIQIKSGQAFILKISKEKSDIKKWNYLGREMQSTTIEKNWNLSFANGGPELPANRKSVTLKSWTAFGDEKANKFSGSGLYETTFNFNPKSSYEYILDLGKVAESAKVWVNGIEVGIVWSIPFEVRVGKYLKKGKNTLKIEVNNLMANRIRDLDQKGVNWRNYHEINFVNIDYKAFNAKDWKLMPSGLLGPVVLRAYQQD
ncbi:glycosyl hydrolase [Pseudopedobacter sp.]|uniref:glycosyl hydrolase n=1 Tax=Pseudopedobacter sp. TaxID=1936787 RepID=UPI00333FF17F